MFFCCGVWMLFLFFSGEESSQARVPREADPGAGDRNVQEHRRRSANGDALRRPLHICGEAGVGLTCGGRPRYNGCDKKDHFRCRLICSSICSVKKGEKCSLKCIVLSFLLQAKWCPSTQDSM